MMKKLLPILLLLFTLISFDTNAQELNARWGSLKKVKKASFNPNYDFAGTNKDGVFVINYSKKRIMLNSFDKNTLNIIQSIPLDLKKIVWKNKKNVKAHYYKALVNEGKIYLFVYIDVKGKNGQEIHLLAAIFNFKGVMESDWKSIDWIGSVDIYNPSISVFNDERNNIFFNKSTNLIVTKKESIFGSASKFYDQNLEEVKLEEEANLGNVLFSKNGKIWSISMFNNDVIGEDSCLKVIELEHLNGLLKVKSEKCIVLKANNDSIKQDSLVQNNKFKKKNSINKFTQLYGESLPPEISISLVGEDKLQILQLVGVKNKFVKTVARQIDLYNGNEILNVEYNFTEKEQEEFNKSAIALSYDYEANKETKAFSLVIPNNAIDNLPFFHSEIRNKSIVHSTSTSTGFSGGNQVITTSTYSQVVSNYGYIFTFWLNDSNNIKYKWIYKRQHGGGGNSYQDAFLSYLPFELNNNKYFFFVGNSFNFAFGNNMRLSSPYSNTVGFGYYSIDSNGNIDYKELTKKLNLIPITTTYHFDGEKFYVLALSHFRKKIRLVEISPKN